MQRRELILSAVSAAFLAACGGGTPDGAESTPTVHGLEAGRLSSNREESIAFARAASAVFTSDHAADSFSDSPDAYFAAAGVSSETVSSNATLVAAISLLKSKDMHVAVAIGDFDFFFSQAIAQGLITRAQQDRIVAAATRAASKTSGDPTTVNFKAISPLVFGKNGPKTIASALVVATGYAAYVAFAEEGTGEDQVA